MGKMGREEPGYRDRNWSQGDPWYPSSFEGLTADSLPPHVPSLGSLEHPDWCRPCVWFHKGNGCRNERECTHCHLCGPGATKNKRKGKGKEKGDKGGRRMEIYEPEMETQMPAPSANSRQAVTANWSRGSEMHGLQRCRPCMLLWTSAGCKEGEDCEYCHICIPDKFKNLSPPPPPPGGPPAQERGPLAPPAGPAPPGPFAGSPQSIQLAERLQEPPAPMVLGTAPLRSQPRPTRRVKAEALSMPMGAPDGEECFDCGFKQHCICLPGGRGFSQQLPLFRGESNGRMNGAAGEVGPALQQSLRDLMSEDLEGERPETSLPESGQLSHDQAPDRRKTKKIGNMSLQKSKGLSNGNVRV